MKPSPSYSYLIKEALLILLLSYFTLVAGSLDGLAHFRTRITAHIIIVMIFAIWLGIRARQRDSLPRTPLDAAIVGFLAVKALVTLFSTNPRLSLESLLQTCIYALLFYLLVDLIRRGWPTDLFVKALLTAGGIACLLGLIEALGWYASWLSLVGTSHLVPPVMFRLSETLGWANPMAAYLNLLIPLGIVTAISTRTRADRLILAGWIILAFIVQFLTSSRGGWLGLAVAVVTLTLLLSLDYGLLGFLGQVYRKLGKVRVTLIVALGAAISTAGLVIIGLEGYSYLSRHPTHVGSTGAHLAYWHSAMKVLAEHPLVGSGPFTFGSQFIRHGHPESQFLVEKAHNVLLSLGAETGLMGLAAYAWLTWQVSHALLQAWNRAVKGQRLIIIACASSLLGSLVHNQVDDFFGLPSIVITAMLLVVISLEGWNSRSEEEARPSLRKRLPIRWLLAPAAILALIMAWTDLAYYYFYQGAGRASAGNWSEAIPYLERAVDLDPGFAFYRLRLGYVYGTLAHGEAKGNRYLGPAISAYERGIKGEPYFCYNHGNLAALYWQAGYTEQAVDSMKQAISALPSEITFHINLGYYYESLARDQEAIEEYTWILSQEPELANTSFWRQTELRRRLLEEGQATFLASTSSQPESYEEYVQLGWQKHEEGDLNRSRALFEKARDLDPTSPDAYVGLASSQLEMGNFAASEHLAKVALFLGDRRNTHFVLGRLAYQQGELEEAVEEYETGLTDYFRVGKYGWFVFRREFIQAPETLPQLIQLSFTDALARRYMELGQLYEEGGAYDEARLVYSNLLEYDPDFEDALEALARVE